MGRPAIRAECCFERHCLRLVRPQLAVSDRARCSACGDRPEAGLGSSNGPQRGRRVLMNSVYVRARSEILGR